VKGAVLFSAVGCLLTALAVEPVRVESLQDGHLWRVRMARNGKWPTSGMNRYGIFRDLPALKTGTELPLSDVRMKQIGKGFDVSFPLAKDESIYGLGDVNRLKLNRRGGAYELWIVNMTEYTPVPLALSSADWGVLLNTSWRTTADVGKTDPDRMSFRAKEGEVDFYLLKGSPREMLDAYSSLTGRPSILPVWGYGFTYVVNQESNMLDLLNNAVEFRRGKFPCDMLGLDPGWMDRHYDYSVHKGWSTSKFNVLWPYLVRRETFIGTLDRLGMKLNLWICCDYDHFEHEEAELAGKSTRKHDRLMPKAWGGMTDGWADERMNKDAGIELTKMKSHSTNGLSHAEAMGKRGKEPWFEHLKEFVAQGAQGFKMDGALQVVDHPDREWANGMTDEEAHNLYPLVYSKEMVVRHEEYTGLRPMTYTDCGWAGFQQYSATWAGDVGGCGGPLAAMLQQGICGHSNSSCDMVTTDVRALHFGFLSPWSLLDDWAFFFYPWMQDDAHQAVFRAYDELHYRLLPYIYTAAHQAYATGWPIMRTLALEYPAEHPRYDDCLTAWKFGDDLLVAAFTNALPVPAGDWYEWRTGKKVTGPTTVAVPVTEDWGGALYVRAGAIVPLWPVKQHVEKGWNEKVEFHVWPGESGTAELYEDDGVTTRYRKGEGAVTKLTLATEKGWFSDARVLTVSPRQGAFKDMPSARDTRVVWHYENRAVTNDLGAVSVSETLRVEEP